MISGEIRVLTKGNIHATLLIHDSYSRIDYFLISKAMIANVNDSVYKSIVISGLAFEINAKLETNFRN